MNKSQMDYISNRINAVAMCICGRITEEYTSKVEKCITDLLGEGVKLSDIGDYSSRLDVDKIGFYLLIKGVLTLKKDLSACKRWSDAFNMEVATSAIKTINKALQDTTQRDERIEVVHLAAKRLQDEIILGIIPSNELPQRLEDLAKENY